MKKLFYLFFVLMTYGGMLSAQVSLPTAGTSTTIDFTGFDGSGVEASPTAGQLDSDDWAFTGFSNGDLMFGGSGAALGTDYAKGVTTGGIFSGGIYAFDDGTNQMMWIQATGSDFSPGSATLRLQNNSGAVMNDLTVDYLLTVLNDADRANSFNFSWSTDDVTYTNVPALDYTSPEAQDGITYTVNQSTTISGLSVAMGAFFYIRWDSDDVAGGGSRDEFGLDDIVLTIPTSSPAPNFSFSGNGTTVSEGAGSVDVVVNISATEDCSVDLDMSAALSSATNGMDFTFGGLQTLTFTNGGATSMTVNVPITDDTDNEGDETIVFYLSNSAGSGGCGISSVDTFTVTITDNEISAYPIGTVNTVDANGIADSAGVLVEIQGTVYGVNLRPGGLQFTIIDATGGIGLFEASNDYGYTVTEGDDVVVQGTIGQFNGLTQINPDTVWMVSAGNALKMPTVVSQLGEVNESDLTRLLGVHLVDPSEWTGSGSGFNVRVTDGGTDTSTVRIDDEVSLYSMPAPTGTFNVTGLGGQFDNSNPFTEGYQLLPRYDADIDSAGTPTGPPAYPIGTINTEDVDGVADSLGVNCEIQGIVYGVNLRPSGLQFTIIDATGGIALFNASGNYGYTVTEGDEVVVQGTISQFNGLTQINPDTVWMVSAGNTLKTPTVVAQLSEATESDLTRLLGVHLVDPAQWTGTGSGFNVRVTDGGTDTVTVRIDNDVNLYSLAAPTGTFNVTGLGGQFDSSNPYTSGYQLLPRYDADIDSGVVANPTVSFANTTASVDETGGSIDVDITIAASNGNATSVDVNLNGSGTATSGTDFSYANTTVTFPASSSANQTVTVTINDDVMMEPGETIILELSNPTNGATIGTGTTTITILDDDTPLPAYTIATVTTNDAMGHADSLGVTCQLQGIVHGVNLRPAGLQFTFIDATGGIGLFNGGGNFGYTVDEGDEVIVQGTISEFNGLTQINPDTVWLVSTGNPLQVPTVTSIMGEVNESEMARAETFKIIDPAQWTGTGSGFNVDITNTVDTISMRIDNDVNLYSMPVPMGWFNVTGIGGQFDSTDPRDDGYQLLPRYEEDIEPLNTTIGFAGSGSGSFIQEDAGTATVDIEIVNPNPDSSTVMVSLDPSSTASFGADFTFSPVTLVFPGNSTTTLSVSIGIVDDSDTEGDETVVLALSNVTNAATGTGTYMVTIQDNDGIGIDNGELDNLVKVYPNPTTDVLFINADISITSVSVLNMVGQEVMRSSAFRGNQKLDVSHLKTGMYIVRIESEEGSWVGKVLKE